MRSCWRRFDASVHFLFFDEFAAVSLLEAFSDTGSKARVLLQQPEGRVRYQFFRVQAFLRGDFRQPQFFFGREAYFHISPQ
jgi:hypothetical protein